MRIRPYCYAASSFVLASCAITQKVTPVERIEGKQVCIVENLEVIQQGFIDTYQRVLRKKGYSVRLLPTGTPVTACETTSTYTAQWRWDLALYMAFADIRVFKSGAQTGQALYDSLGGSFNMNKFVKGEVKIEELVNSLFPDAD